MTSWNTRWRALVCGALLAAAAPARAEEAQSEQKAQKALPQGWFVTESVPGLYTSGVDTDTPCEGPRSAWLRSLQDNPSGYGTFMQSFDAAAFRGQRLRFSAVVRTENVQGWAGLWMRVEGEEGREPLAFDNMQSRALTGTTACKRHEVVLDVPREARAILAGLLLSGTGKAWMGAVRFEPVDTRVPVTNLIPDPAPRRPSEGRIGATRFTADTVEPGPRRQPDGHWKDGTASDVTQTPGEDGGVRVEGTLLGHDAQLTVKTAGGTTVIRGDWGEGAVHLELRSDALVLRHGLRSRILRPESDALPSGCRRYRNPQAPLEEVVDICGLALDPAPPAVPLTVALLSALAHPTRAQAVPFNTQAPPDRLSSPTLPSPPRSVTPAPSVAPLRQGSGR